MEGRSDLGSSSMDVLPPFEMLVPLVTLGMAQTILSISLLQHLKSLCKSFSQFETEFEKQTRCSSRSFIFQLAKKFAEGTKHTLIHVRLAR